MSILLDDDLGLLDVISPHSSSSAPSSPTLSPHWKQPSTSTQHVTSSPLSLSSTTDDDDLFESSPQTQPLMFSPSIAPINMTRLPSLSMKTDESLPSLSMKTDDLFDPNTIIDTDILSRHESHDIIRADVMSRMISDGMTTHITDMMERGNEYDEMLTSQHQHILNALSTETSIFPAFQYGWPNETQAFTAPDVTQSQTYTAPTTNMTEEKPSIKTEPVSAAAESLPVVTVPVVPVSVVPVVPTPIVDTTSPVVTRTTRRTRGSPTAASAAAAAATTTTPTSISVVVDPVTAPIIERRPSASSAASLPAPASPLAGSRRARKRTKGSTKSTSPSSSPTSSTTSATVIGRKRKKSTASVKKESDIEDDDESVTSNSTVVDKKQQRLERNRASAQLSRERRKNYMSQLEEQLRELTASNQTLTQQLNALDHENQTLKKLIANKKAASTTPSSTPSETGAARSALLLFAVVISFGLFFHMAGLPQQTEPVGIRVQTSVPTPGPSPSVTSMHRSRVLSSIETESDRALIALEEAVDSNARALVPIVKQEPGSDLGLALDVYKQDSSTTNAMTETTPPQTTSAEDPLIAYEKLLAGSNFTHDPDAAYMFCPSALQMHIQSRNDTIHTNYTSTQTSTSDMDSKRFQLVDEHAKRSRERSDRLRRVMGLSSVDDKSSIPIVYTSDRTSSSHGILPRRTVPGGVPSYDSIGADAAKMYLSSRSDRLLLWVPIRALKPQWEYNHTMADSTDSGLVEIDCRIDDIRPLLLA